MTSIFRRVTSRSVILGLITLFALFSLLDIGIRETELTIIQPLIESDGASGLLVIAVHVQPDITANLLVRALPRGRTYGHGRH
jgi:hypothetical protein